MAHVNILKQVKADDRWKLVAIPRTKKGGYDWESLPDGRYFVEWYERGKRKREAGGGTAAEALEVARRRRHVLEGKSLGLGGPEEEETKRTAVHVAVKHYLASVEALKKPNTLRKYKAVLERFVEFLPPNADPRKVTRDDLTDFMVRLGEEAVRRILGVLNLTKKYGVASTDEACALGLETRASHYHFVRRYLEHNPQLPLSLRQVDPLIRQLTLYRDLIESRTQNSKQENPS